MKAKQQTIPDEIEITAELIGTFRARWHKFPVPIILLHRCNTIVAVNEQAWKLSKGKLACGIKYAPVPEERGRSVDAAVYPDWEAVSNLLAAEGVWDESFDVGGENQFYLHFCLLG